MTYETKWNINHARARAKHYSGGEAREKETERSRKAAHGKSKLRCVRRSVEWAREQFAIADGRGERIARCTRRKMKGGGGSLFIRDIFQSQKRLRSICLDKSLGSERARGGGGEPGNETVDGSNLS